ncbi:MAG: efflux transporter periplasmic adaptor subunit, partial [Rhodospirillaceae bacterium]|nr:efflux transporter periplasmic adaptor subunit [Rhodospirillaceae bacterium]
RVRRITAENYTSTVVVTGQTEASRRIVIRSQVAGRIAFIDADEGDPVKRGGVLVRFDREDWPARVAESKARVKQREMEYEAARKLARKGFQAETKLAAAFANLQAAKASQERMQTNLENTTIRLPFDGILNHRLVELGDFLKKGDRVAEVVDLDPVLVTAYVSERDYFKLARGQTARARLTDDTVLNGVIRYISVAAQPDTRTFKVELEIPNPDLTIVDGVTAELALPLPAIPAHRVSAALFTLDKDGRLGVKTVDASNKVLFVPVQLIGGTDREVFITGLPQEADVIIVGQDFVEHGETVKPVNEDDLPGVTS